MASPQGDLYQILGVPRTASAVAIRIAYGRRLHEHYAKASGEDFEPIRQAYDVLRVPALRRSYDAGEVLPGQVWEGIREWLRLAHADPAGAAKTLGSLARRHPGIRLVRALHGQALLNAGQHRRAATIFERLVEEEPENASWTAHLGEALLGVGQEERATAMMERAMLLDPGDPRPYLALAWWLWQYGCAPEAVEVLEQAVQADGREDFSDFDLLVKVLLLHLLTRDMDAATAVEDRLVAVVPPDDDARRCAAADLIYGVGRLREQGRLDLAWRIVSLIARILPDNEAIRHILLEMEPAAERCEERVRLLEDPSIAQWIKGFVGTMATEEDPDARLNAVIDVGFQASKRGKEMAREWAMVTARYPLTALFLERDWDTIVDLSKCC